MSGNNRHTMYLGIEIGGTKLQLGVGTGQGQPFTAFRRLNVDGTRGADGILKQIEQAGRELIDQFPVRAVGYGFGGPIDAAAGLVTKSHQVTGWDNFPLAAWTTKTLGLPTFLGNDCDMAALAEARFGAGRGKRSVFYVTVGTGIGGGLVLDGELYGSDRPAAAEIGHLRFGPADTIESIASGPGIESAARAALLQASLTGQSVSPLLVAGMKDPSAVTAKLVADAAREGDALALRVMKAACMVLGWGIAQMITLLAVEVVIVGGGVSLAGEQMFFAPLRERVAEYVFPPLRNSYEIVPPQLGEEVVVHGALALAADRLSSESDS